jgi:glucosamine--fructose-6-phosphate aminotransferase (isomerizing)
MSQDLSIVEGAYFKDILDQPRALIETCAGLRAQPALNDLAARLRQGDFRRVVLTGMGSSYHALHPLNLELVDQGLSPIMMETSELIHYGQRFFDSATLLVAVSQSGRSVEIVRLLEVNRMRASIVAVTNTPESSLVEQANAVVLTRAGEESTVSCKTYVCSLVALRWLADLLGVRSAERTLLEFTTASPAVEKYLAGIDSHVRAFAKELEGVRSLFTVGRGSSLAAVGTGALIVKESDRFHAEGLSSAAFRHGPMEMLNAGMFVLVFGGNLRTRALNERLCMEIRGHGAKAFLCSPDSEFDPARIPDLAESVRPIIEILPVQMITLALAALAGREAGRFEKATKITSTE